MTSFNTTLDGRIIVNVRGGAVIHTYVAPESGLLVTTHLLETANGVTVIDAQLRPEHALEVKAYADALAKPIERLIVTHGHPDHFAGTSIFGNVPVYATGATRGFIRTAGQTLIDEYGINATSVTPTHEIEDGRETLDGLTYEYRIMKNAEADENLVALLPDIRIVVAQDIVYNGTHLYLDKKAFRGWHSALRMLRELPEYDIVLAGHGEPTGPAVYESVDTYLTKAEEVLRWEDRPDGVRAAMVGAFPERTCVALLETGLRQLFGAYDHPHPVPANHEMRPAR